MKTISIPGSFISAVMMLLLFISCDKEVKNESTEEIYGSNSVESNARTETELLKAVRMATARFNSTTQTINAGYILNDHCVSVLRCD